ncbi:MAG: FAD-dependent oxidoreductase [Spirochaetaceae bacterium]|nr:FAD-dependent oxidoreductase [Spirochaetaceae bacterium]
MKIIIAGNGAAGIAAAEAIRENDQACELSIFSNEPGPHYSRPRVIEYLGGKVAPDKIAIKSPEYYRKNNISLHSPADIVSIDTEARRISLSDSQSAGFDTLIIAMGANSFLPPVEGSKLEGIFTLRTIADASAIIDYSRDKKKALVIGAGLLGLETASNLSHRGLETSVVEVAERLLPRQLDSDAAQILQGRLESQGLRFLLSRQTTKIERKGGGLLVSFVDGSSVQTDIVLFSAGVRSNLAVAQKAGILCEKGVCIDGHMRTSVPFIYAAGDVAQFNGTVYGLWPIAREQGKLAGLNAIGVETEYKGSVLSTKLKVTGIDVASVGAIDSGQGTEARTLTRDGNFARLFIKDQKISGGIMVGDSGSYNQLQAMIREGKPIPDPEALLFSMTGGKT